MKRKYFVIIMASLSVFLFLRCNSLIASTKICILRCDTDTGCVAGNCVNGTGTYKYSNGDCFTGGFKNGKRNGQGTCVYISGDKYVGEWKDDLFDGKGAYYFSNCCMNCRVLCGYWSGGQKIRQSQYVKNKPT